MKFGTRRLVNEEGRYAEDGKITELEFPEDFAEFEFLVGFKTEEEEQFQQLLARLNSIDNAIQSCLESEMQQPIPQFTVYFAKKHGRWQAYWDADCQKVIEES